MAEIMRLIDWAVEIGATVNVSGQFGKNTKMQGMLVLNHVGAAVNGSEVIGISHTGDVDEVFDDLTSSLSEQEVVFPRLNRTFQAPKLY